MYQYLYNLSPLYLFFFFLAHLLAFPFGNVCRVITLHYPFPKQRLTTAVLRQWRNNRSDKQYCPMAISPIKISVLVSGTSLKSRSRRATWKSRGNGRKEIKHSLITRNKYCPLSIFYTEYIHIITDQGPVLYEQLRLI